MQIGVIADAHGNYIGLQQCLAYLRERSDKIYFLGDAVGYFPFPNEVIDQLKDSRVTCIAGNHDAMLLGNMAYPVEKEYVYQIVKSRQLISSDNLSFLKQLPDFIELDCLGRKVLFVHGSQADHLNGYVYPDTDLTQFCNTKYDYVFSGHTHRQFFRESGKTKYVNVGSCGFSRDHGNRITCVLFEPKKDKVTFKNFLIDKSIFDTIQAPHVDKSIINIINRNNINEA